MGFSFIATTQPGFRVASFSALSSLRSSDAGDAGDKEDRAQCRADDGKNETGGVDALLFLLVCDGGKHDANNTENDADPAIVGNAGNQAEDAKDGCKDAENQRNNAHFFYENFTSSCYLSDLSSTINSDDSIFVFYII